MVFCWFGCYCFVAIINAIFAVLAILGVVNDPTTSGMSDSKQAMTYETPKKDK